MIKLKAKGGFKNTERYLKDKIDDKRIMSILDKYGSIGVELLSKATPVDSSKTATSWGYSVENTEKGKYSIQFTNSNINNGVNIAVILQYGHGTRNGGYVKGIDYINPPLRTVFEEMKNELIKEVRRK